MVTLKKGKSEMKPEKGQKVGCYYKGHLDGPDGKIFDQLQVIFFRVEHFHIFVSAKSSWQSTPFIQSRHWSSHPWLGRGNYENDSRPNLWSVR